MRIGLIGCSYHWGSYKALLEALPEARVVAVAPGCAQEKPEAFAKAAGVTEETRRFADARELLDRSELDLVQVSTEFTAMGGWVREAAQRGVPVTVEKPLAFDLAELAQTWDIVSSTGTPVYAMQGTQGWAVFEAAKAAVASGAVGEVYASHHQKSYRWAARPASWQDRRTFPGFIPWVGIHAFGWMEWILGDVFTEVAGWDGYALHPEVPGCATQAGLVFKQANGGFATVSLDYLRPKSAPTHGDERLRIAGSLGVVEAYEAEGRCTLVTADAAPRALELPEHPADPVVTFARFLRGESQAPTQTWEAFRVTEWALKAQQAADTGKPVALLPTAYRA